MELRKEDCENRFQIETLEEWIAPTADETACAPGMDLDGRTDTVVAADARSCSPCPPTIRPHVAPERLVPQPPDAAAAARHPWRRAVAELEAIRQPRTLPAREAPAPVARLQVLHEIFEAQADAAGTPAAGRKPQPASPLVTRLEQLGKMLRPTPHVPLAVEGMNLFAKLEYVNPVGSIKDRAAYWILTRAAERGEISQET